MKIVILGAGITGRMAKLLLPNALLIDKNHYGDKTLAELGTHYLHEPIAPIAGERMRVQVGCGETMEPLTVETMVKYTEKMGCDLWEQECNPFSKEYLRPEHTKWEIKIPDVEVKHGYIVREIDMHRRRITCHSNAVNKSNVKVSYDVIINTISLSVMQKICLAQFDPKKLGLNYKPIYFKVNEPVHPELEPNEAMIEYDVTDSIFLKHFHRKQLTWSESVERPDKYDHRVVYGRIEYCKYVHDILRLLKSQGIYCFGRFARWDKEMTITQTWKNMNAWVRSMGLINN